ncbi:MAG: sortase [Candidatus Doudnabacteria bacterium]|nr:sortase [Candidatus Doudnabacteria bacterium]
MDQEYFQSEIHRLLKLGPDLSKPYQPQVSEDSTAAINTGVPLNLPMQSADEIVPKFNNRESGRQAEFQLAPKGLSEAKHYKNAKFSKWTSLLVYPFVFLVAFAFFYLILNFNAIIIQMQGWFAKDETEVILEEDLAAYEQWIGGYFFAIKDREKLEPNQDIDNDGLSNLDEFTIKTNPTVNDSDYDGTSDGIEVINGTNPWGTGQMTAKQKKTLENLDLIKVNNRISFNASSANPLSQISHSQNFDMKKPGRLSIPKLNLQVPIIWTEDSAQFDQDLTRGVVHYPGTALPGETGTVYISGHSSDYFWKSHPYKQVFAKINALDVGDDIFVDVYGLDGKIYNYKYRVVAETIYSPDDQRQFIDNSGAKLNLSTCWPIGTQKDRYVVTAELQNL